MRIAQILPSYLYAHFNQLATKNVFVESWQAELQLSIPQGNTNDSSSKNTAAACFQLSISLEKYPSGLEIIPVDWK